MRRFAGLGPVGIATIIAGLCGYAVTWLVPRTLGFAEYATFAVFWGLLFFLIATLSGIQQEVTRASSGVEAATHPARPFRGATLAALVVAGLLAAVGAFAAPVIFGRMPELAPPVIVGVCGYIFVAVASGLLYGRRNWTLLVSMIVFEAVARLLGIGIVLAAGGGVVAAAWVSAGAIPLTVIVHLFWLRRALRDSRLDAPPRRILLNIARTMVAASSLGIMVSGLPFLMSLSPHYGSGTSGALVVVITFARAPIVIIAMALQSYLIVVFRAAEKPRAVLRRISAFLVLGGVVLAALAWLLGPALFDLIFDESVDIPTIIYPLTVVSSLLVGLLTVTGTALLSEGRHGWYSGSWAAAALATLGCFLLPTDLVTQTLLALLVAPLVGLALQAVALVSVPDGNARAQ